jgi:hemerythrin
MPYRFAVWQDRYRIGMPAIDEQHQQLFAMANDLYRRVRAGKSGSQITPTVDFLLNYTRSHFVLEEELMRKHGYPDLPAHRAEHVELLRQTEVMMTRLRSGETVAMLELAQFLIDWLMHHVLETDQKLASFFQAKGLSPI